MAQYSSLFFRKDRVSTGIRELDSVLEGGYQSGGIVMVSGAAGQDKHVFAFHFAMEGLKAGERVIYIALDLGPQEIENKASSFGMNLKSYPYPALAFIDAYSQTISAGAKEAIGRHDLMVAGPNALNDLSLAISELVKEGDGKNIRVIFHSISTLALYSPQETLMRFLQVVEGRLKSANATTLWLLDEGMHDKKFISSMEGLCDTALRISDQSGMRELSISGIPLPLQIRTGAAGIEVL